MKIIPNIFNGTYDYNMQCVTSPSPSERVGERLQKKYPDSSPKIDLKPATGKHFIFQALSGSVAPPHQEIDGSLWRQVVVRRSIGSLSHSAIESFFIASSSPKIDLKPATGKHFIFQALSGSVAPPQPEKCGSFCRRVAARLTIGSLSHSAIEPFFIADSSPKTALKRATGKHFIFQALSRSVASPQQEIDGSIWRRVALRRSIESLSHSPIEPFFIADSSPKITLKPATMATP